ncbi:MAG: General secretion pathway protein F [Alphaproteobacteria bacterium]|nr:MAG: General secretion pathway protein F [Caulobacteraceae bacterium]TPW07060.1 MAG: General secretion pathway protein F [Alphaproteobacteria bacterium]
MSQSFRYEARAPSGRIERGVLAATTRDDALARLHRRQLTPLSLKDAEHVRGGDRLSDKAARDLARSLAQLLRSGLSLTQALRFASEELSADAAAAATRMREVTEQGEPASQALASLDGAEARLLHGVFVAGESSGRLAEALEVAAEAFARAAEMRARIATALIYPAFVIAATIATLGCFLLLVVPTLAQAFEGVEDRLPASTQSLLALSAWLQANGLVLLAASGAVAALAIASDSVRAAAARIIDAVLASPASLEVAAPLEYANFARLAALSLDAGVPSATAFAAAAAGVRNGAIRAQLERAVAAIRVGETPSTALARLARPPRALMRLVLVGEETGRLAEALRNAGALLASDAEQRLQRLGAIAGPIVTLVLGGLVASVVMSLFLGLLALSDVAAA